MLALEVVRVNVWLINHYATTPRAMGGTRPFALARSLVERGHDVVLIAGTFNHLTRVDEFPTKTWSYGLQDVEGVRFLWIDTPAYGDNGYRRVRNVVTFTRRVLRLSRAGARLPRPDVIVGSSPHLLAPLAAERLARRFGVPFVLEVRDVWPASLVDVAGLSRRHPLVVALGWLERYLCGRATAIVSPLSRLADHVAELGADPAKVTWIPNGVDLSIVPAVREPPGGSPLTLMYAGAHGAANGLDVLLRAAELVEAARGPDLVRWRFVGNGPDKPGLIAWARERGLRSVRFEDPVPKDEIYDRLAEADAFVVNVRDEPVYRFGVSLNKFFDFLAAGRPTVIGMHDGWNPFRESRSGITVRADDPEAFAAGVVRLTELSVAERAAMGARGRAFVESRHDLHALGGDLERVLERAVGAGGLAAVGPRGGGG